MMNQNRVCHHEQHHPPALLLRTNFSSRPPVTLKNLTQKSRTSSLRNRKELLVLDTYEPEVAEGRIQDGKQEWRAPLAMALTWVVGTQQAMKDKPAGQFKRRNCPRSSIVFVVDTDGPDS